MLNSDSNGAHVLVTGCTGFVGKVVLAELVRRRAELGVERVYLLIRPRGRKTVADRFKNDVVTSPCFSRLEPGWQSMCEAIAGDITEDGLGISEGDATLLRGTITHIIHCAASVRFDLPIVEAARINITGALTILDFAQTCTALTRLVDVSTAYVTPNPGRDVPIYEKLVELPFDAEEVYNSIRSGRANEKALLARTGHANTYTFTKCVAETLLRQRHGHVPLTLLRPSIVSACHRYPFPGWIDSRAAYAAFISLLGAGYLRVVRVDPDAVADLVPCDVVADRILSCAFEPALQQPFVIRHAVAGLQNSGTFSRLAYTHERHFRKWPHEREARWRYVGRNKAFFRFNEWLHHHVPYGTARWMSHLMRKREAASKIRRLANVIAQLDETFYYFSHHTFDFRTEFPPFEDFDLEAYLEVVTHGISEHLLKRDPREAPLRIHGTDMAWALRQPDGNRTQRVFAYFMRKALRAAGTETTFNEAAILAAVANVRNGDLVVLAPSHRSYMDFLVTSLLCFAHPGLGLRLPKVAATDDFARIPLVGRVLAAAGAFYIRRGVGPDPRLNEQITELVHAGHSLSFYPEGTRSRSRRFLAPKRGILRALQQAGRSAVVLPLAISYDRVAEEEGFLRELDGRAKHKGGLKLLLKWVMKLIRGEVKLGRIHISCGTPQRLDADTDVKALSNEVIAELQRHTAVTTFHIAAFCHDHRKLGIEPAALRAAIMRRGGVVIDSKLDGIDQIPPLIRRTYEGQWMHLFYADAERRAAGNVAVASHIRRNGFWYPDSQVYDDEVAEVVLQALFEPVCHDYQRVAHIVESMAADATVTVHELLARIPGAFMRDVEDALEDLTARGVLVRERDTYRCVSGPTSLGDYRNDCAWHTADHTSQMIA
jgi:thioester reductase-like protein/1-acyl-sn-glycerol-3-phosphate acyltransferase